MALDPQTRPVARRVTAELLARYDRPGPRYTSYPTAVDFEAVAPEAYRRWLAVADRKGGAWSIYVHLPFCEERCLFCGCHVIATRRRETAVRYLDLLARELDLLAGALPRRRTVLQLHLGGGTPTYYTPAELVRLLRPLLAAFPPQPGAEQAVEVDPRVTTGEHLAALAELGFNRLSLGVQDFTPEVQAAIGRRQSVAETEALVRAARDCGFRGINVDLIYGLPYQSPPTFERTLEEVLRLGVDRAAVYSFAYVPWVKGHQKRLPAEALPPREVKFALFALARERFLEAGYEPIGMDHFARPEDELARARREGRLRRNFQGYTVLPAADVLGLGISAIGDVAGAYVQNTKKLSRYEEHLRAGRLPVERGVRRSRDDEVRRFVIHELMCNFRVSIPAVEERFRLRFWDYFRVDLEALEEYAREGLVSISAEEIRATPLGELFVRNLAMCFDRYLREKHTASGRPLFSRTV